MTEFQWNVVLALCRIVMRLSLNRADSIRDQRILLEALEQVDKPK